jgi:two-component system, chemotaxis family, chemotaxis protein CheY
MARILIIDDSTFQRRILLSLLKEMGHSVLEASNGREGLDTALREKPDLIITDLLMPELDGFSFLREAKKAGLATPVLIVTSDIQTATRDRCLSLGASGVLNKPVKKEILSEMVNRMLTTGNV